mgnify:CR=1 FL=1
MRLLGYALSPVALFVVTPPLCLLTLLLTMALCVLADVLCLLTLALAPPSVLVVAVRVRGSPQLADIATDVFSLSPTPIVAPEINLAGTISAQREGTRSGRAKPLQKR